MQGQLKRRYRRLMEGRDEPLPIWWQKALKYTRINVKIITFNSMNNMRIHTRINYQSTTKQSPLVISQNDLKPARKSIDTHVKENETCKFKYLPPKQPSPFLLLFKHRNHKRNSLIVTLWSMNWCRLSKSTVTIP